MRFSFLEISDNGKSIGEVRAKMNEKFNFNRAEQIAFSDDQFKEKSNMKSKLRLKNRAEQLGFHPAFCKCHVIYSFYLLLVFFLSVSLTVVLGFFSACFVVI